MLTRGGSTKATTASTIAARRIQRRGEGRFSSTPILTDQMQRSAPPGLIEEVKNHVGIERKLVAQTLFVILIAGLDKRPVDEQRATDDIGSRHEAPVAAVEADGAVISHGKIPARGHHEVLALNVVGKIGGPGWGHVPALRWGYGGKVVAGRERSGAIRGGLLRARVGRARWESHPPAAGGVVRHGRREP